MYCPKCANEVKPELNYCSSCGFRVDSEKRPDSSSISKQLAKSLGWIGVAGLISFVFVIKLLLENGIKDGALVAVCFLYLGTIFGISAFILSYIKSNRSELPRSAEEPAYKAPREVSGRNTNQLEPGQPNPASVVEHTTRTLDKVLVNKE